jgi:hypothetical protein
MRNTAPRLSRAAIAITLVVASLQGCVNMTVWNFKPATASGQGKGSVKLYLHEPGADAKQKYAPDAATLAAYPKLKDALDACKPDGPGIQGTSAIILPAVGKLLFDLYMDKQVRDLDALKAAAEKSYHGRMVVSADTLQGAVSGGHCLVLTRSLANDKVPEFVAVLALERAPRQRVIGQAVKAFVFKPTYVAARSAVAVTRQAEDAKVSVAFALSVRGLGKQDNGLPAFAQVGEAAVTVPGVSLSAGTPLADAACSGKKECPGSDPLPLLDGKEPVAIGVGVTETGDIGVDFDAAKSELNAIKAAIGPVVSDVLKEKLE